MTSIHIYIPSLNKWHSRHYVDDRVNPTKSAVWDLDDDIKNLENTRGWKVKVGYNLLREVHIVQSN